MPLREQGAGNAPQNCDRVLTAIRVRPVLPDSCRQTPTRRRAVQTMVDPGRIGLPTGRTDNFGRNSLVNPYGCPACDLVGTAGVLVAADVEAAIEFAGRAVFAHVGRAPDLDDGAETDVPGTSDGIMTAADVCPGRRDAR